MDHLIIMVCHFEFNKFEARNFFQKRYFTNIIIKLLPNARHTSQCNATVCENKRQIIYSTGYEKAKSQF